MLAIRLQRTGRKGHPMYRFIVQEAHRQPTSGKVVAQLGSYNPHTKEVTLDKEKAELYLKNGAQPSDRVIRLFTEQKVSLPAWVQKLATDKQKSIKNLEKLRRNQPKEEVTPEAPSETADAEMAEASAEPGVEVAAETAPTGEVAEVPANEPVADEVKEESSDDVKADEKEA